jgi:asparagine synthase (glutamine-hydrolysing)
MVAAQHHRGPDDNGFVLLGGCGGAVQVALGSTRLAIIDLSPAGHQPMANDESTAWVVYNGEIYNFADLRAELVKDGARFRSKTDTEVIAHGYRRWGIEGLLARLNGMFAFALWDSQTQRLYLARDRLGEKPLYYSWDERTLVFASELKAILASGLFERDLNPAALAAYLNWGSVPAPMTIVRGVKILEPGCFATLADGKLTDEQYWKLSFTEDRARGEHELIDGVRSLLSDSIKVRLVSDVPVGIFLSGGVDSTAVLALAREAVTSRLNTYSIALDEQNFNEAACAERVARHFGTDHRSCLVTARNVFDALPRIIRAMDQPTNDGVNTYFVSQATRRAGTVVALSGLGGDELFGGYPSFRLVPRLALVASAFAAMPAARSATARMLELAGGSARSAKLAAFLSAPSSVERAYFAVRGLFTEPEVQSLLGADLLYSAIADADAPVAPRAPSGGASMHLLNRVSELELSVYMQNQLLRDTDVMSMAHSLEVRAPFLDHRLVEFVARGPVRFKFNGRPKRLLIKACEQVLPRQVSSGTKRGFTFPFDRWLRSDFRDVVEDWIEAAEPVGIVARPAARALWRSFLDGRSHWTRIWAVVVLKWWVQEVFRTAGIGSQR